MDKQERPLEMEQLENELISTRRDYDKIRQGDTIAVYRTGSHLVSLFREYGNLLQDIPESKKELHAAVEGITIIAERVNYIKTILGLRD